MFIKHLCISKNITVQHKLVKSCKEIVSAIFVHRSCVYISIYFCIFLLVWEIGSLGLMTSSLLLQEGPNENESLRTKLSSQKVSKLLKSGSLLKGNPASFHPDAAEKHSACWFLNCLSSLVFAPQGRPSPGL